MCQADCAIKLKIFAFLYLYKHTSVRMSRNNRLICIQESLTSAKSKKFITGEVQIWFVKAKKNSLGPSNAKILSKEKVTAG